jgi:hypothetical protein
MDHRLDIPHDYDEREHGVIQCSGVAVPPQDSIPNQYLVNQRPSKRKIFDCDAQFLSCNYEGEMPVGASVWSSNNSTDNKPVNTGGDSDSKKDSGILEKYNEHKESVATANEIPLLIPFPPSKVAVIRGSSPHNEKVDESDDEKRTQNGKSSSHKWEAEKGEDK